VNDLWLAIDLAFTLVFIGLVVRLVVLTSRTVRLHGELERQVDQLREILDSPDWRDRR
jgi:hypothetical protein